MDSDQEISLGNLINDLWKEKITIIFITGLFSFSSLLYVLSEENIYRSSVKVFNKSDISSTSIGGISSSISGFLNVGSGNANVTEYAISKINSRDFFSHLINKDKKLIKDIFAAEKYKSSSNTFIYDQNKLDLINNNVHFEKAYKFFKQDVLSVSRNRSSGIITISIDHLSANFAKELLDLIILEINLIMSLEDNLEASSSITLLENSLANTLDIDTKKSMVRLIERNLEKKVVSTVNKESYIFKIVEKPFIPEEKIYPARARTIILFSFIGFAFSLIVLFIKNTYKRKIS